MSDIDVFLEGSEHPMSLERAVHASVATVVEEHPHLVASGLDLTKISQIIQLALPVLLQILALFAKSPVPAPTPSPSPVPTPAPTFPIS